MMYYVEIVANLCMCQIVLNGLGVAVLDAKKVGSVQIPCNTELVGKSNTLSIEVMPATLDLSTLNKTRVECVVKRYEDNEMVEPESGTVIATSTLQKQIDKINANPRAVNIADLVPFVIKVDFDSKDAASFAGRLIQSQPIKDPEILKDWAIAFKTLLEKRDINALFELYEPKLIDYDAAYPTYKKPNNQVWFRRWMHDEIFPETPYTDFTRDEVVPVRWCEGRIWELRLKDGEPLWRTVGRDGTRTKIEVYVGLVDGKIKIVR